MIVKLLHVIFLKSRVAVVHVPVTPAWGMSCSGDCSFFYALHHQGSVSDSGTDGRSYGTAKHLLVMFLFVGEEALLQDKL